MSDSHHSRPVLLSDEIKVFEHFTGIECRVRVRAFDLGNVRFVLFTQNRNPDLYPDLEIVNPGTSITNMAEQLVFLARFVWGLVPEGTQGRFFEHYAGLPPTDQNWFWESTLAEITVPEGFGNITPLSNRVRWGVSKRDGGKVLRIIQPGGWPAPAWRHVSIADGEQFTGLSLSYSDEPVNKGRQMPNPLPPDVLPVSG